MALGVGITENVYIENAHLDDNNYFTISFKEKSDTNNPFLKLQAEDVIEGSDSVDVKLFAPLPRKNEDGKLTKAKMAESVQRDLNKVKGVLQHIMSSYVTKDDYVLGKVMFEGTGIDATNYEDKFQDKAILMEMFLNMCRHFINTMKPFFGDDTKLFRLLLVRTSKDKHFATFRSNYIEENPFWESMEIDPKASKVAFTPYENREGLNDGTPSSRSETADKPKDGGAGGGSAATMTAANVFGV